LRIVAWAAGGRPSPTGGGGAGQRRARSARGGRFIGL